MPAALPPRKLRPAFVAQSVLVGSAIAVYLLVLGSAGHQDLDPYLAAGRHVWNGEPLYATFLQHPFPDPTLRPAFIYPPAFALLIAPLALLPGAMANLVWLIVGQVSLAAAMLLVLRWLRPPSWAVATLVVATLTFYPLWIDVQQGQANLLVLLLVTAGIAGVVQGHPRFSAALGVAAALKLTPLILLAWLLLAQRYRSGGGGLAGCSRRHAWRSAADVQRGLALAGRSGVQPARLPPGSNHRPHGLHGREHAVLRHLHPLSGCAVAAALPLSRSAPAPVGRAARGRRFPLVFAAVVAAVSLLPYLLAYLWTPPGHHFAGFFFIADDAATYLSKMRQGAAGSWLWADPYTSDAHGGVFLFSFYLLFGHLAALLHLPLIATYHLARLSGPVALAFAVARLCRRLIPGQRNLGLVLVLLGSGLGFLAQAAGNPAILGSKLEALDLHLPELSGWYSMLAIPHFTWATALIVIALLGLLEIIDHPGWRAIVATAAALTA